MKHLLIIITYVVISSCIYEDPHIVDRDYYQPVTIKRELLHSTTKLIKARNIVNSGKIYVKDSLLFVGEANQGFHIFDNRDPKNPINKAFLKVLGSSDLSIKNNTIYVNNAVDLIALQPNDDFTEITITKRIKNVFPQMQSPNGETYYNLDEDDIIINWQKVNR